jgi:hypothetical protein
MAYEELDESDALARHTDTYKALLMKAIKRHLPHILLRLLMAYHCAVAC